MPSQIEFQPQQAKPAAYAPGRLQHVQLKAGIPVAIQFDASHVQGTIEHAYMMVPSLGLRIECEVDGKTITAKLLPSQTLAPGKNVNHTLVGCVDGKSEMILSGGFSNV